MKKDSITNEIVEGAIDFGGDAAITLAGLSVAGPQGLLVSGLLIAGKRVLSRVLTQREKDRADRVYEMAIKQIVQKIEGGTSPRKDLSRERYIELTEGTLLKAKDSYEEKKLPLIANLLAAAPFTNTPIENMNQTLIYAEQLSYRQLCEIAVVGQNEWENRLKLSNQPLGQTEGKKKYDELVTGIYAEVNHLLVLGLIGQELSKGAGPAIPSGMFMFAPANLKLLYLGRLLFNGLRLDEVDKRVFEQVVSALKN